MTRHHVGKSNDDEKLMRYYDGELSEAEAAAFSPSENDERKLKSLGQLSDVMRTYYEKILDDKALQLGSMWWRLEDKLDEPVQEAAAPRGLWAWLGARRGYVLTGLVGALVGALIVLGTIGSRVIERQIVIYRDAPAAGPHVLSAAQNAVVEELEVVGGTGTVLQIPSDDAREPDTTVIWVTPAPSEGPI